MARSTKSNEFTLTRWRSSRPHPRNYSTTQSRAKSCDDLVVLSVATPVVPPSGRSWRVPVRIGRPGEGGELGVGRSPSRALRWIGYVRCFSGRFSRSPHLSRQ
jgi:hypothetical protein